MTSHLSIAIGSAFAVLDGKAEKMSAYLSLLNDGLPRNIKALPIATESTIVLLVAWHESFLHSLVAGAAQAKETELRGFLGRSVSTKEQQHLSSIDRGALIAIAIRRLAFKDRARRLEGLFSEIFGFSPWPSESVKDHLLDLNLLRQLIVHNGGGTTGDAYFDQFVNKALLSTRRYGNLPPVRTIDHPACLAFLRTAFDAFGAHVNHCRQELLKRPEWVYRPGEVRFPDSDSTA
jgi:hypothetical protein